MQDKIRVLDLLRLGSQILISNIPQILIRKSCFISPGHSYLAETIKNSPEQQQIRRQRQYRYSQQLILDQIRQNNLNNQRLQAQIEGRINY